MEISFYLPVDAIAEGLFWYFIIGIVLYFPLVFWTERFIVSGRSLWRCFSFRRHLEKGLLSGVAWPVILGYCVKTEIAYRKKGYLGKNKKF